MKRIYTDEEFEIAKSHDKLRLQCKSCQTIFLAEKKVIQRTLSDIRKNNSRKNALTFCSLSCFNKTKENGMDVLCAQCGKKTYKTSREQHRSKLMFCSKSCMATYYNGHKTWCNRRSKLEKWLELKLFELFPTLEIQYNHSDTINSELDIYIPSLKLAIELNGIFHYEPIYSEEQLRKIKNNDQRKFQACLEHQIELCVIDSSQQKKVNDKTCQPFFDIIKNLIDTKLLTYSSLE